MSFQDKVLSCVDCSTQFVFTANEQAFYADRGFTNEPKRCPECRQTRKSSRGSGQAGGGYGGGAQASSNYGGGSRRELHSVTCSACGGEARVPFVPRGDRPVYCSDCFNQNRSESGPSRAGRY
jgi:CxxC-x17-CxxC domain-containing protein